MRVLTAATMKQVDRRAIDEIGIPSLVLMENAAIGVADALAELFPEAEDVAIFCGPGNNGGDGLALARLLDARGYRCRTYLVLWRSEPAGDAAVQLRILENAGLPVERLGQDSDVQSVVAACHDVDLFVDALFGTGVRRPLEGHFVELTHFFSRSKTPCLAVDLASGLDGSQGEPIGPHARATATVTFAAPKVAHILPPAAAAAGELVVTDLGIPPFLVDEAPAHGVGGGDVRLHVLTEEEMAATLLPRPAASHKGTYGHALLVGGSVGKAGAVVLAARAAVRSGAGLVTAMVPEPIVGIVDNGSVESMTTPLTGPVLGGDAVDAVIWAAAGKGAVGIGPGLGMQDLTSKVVRRLVRHIEAPLVVDADALNAFAERLDEIAARAADTDKGPVVLTPHPGEMARLLGTTPAEIQENRLEAARRAAVESGAVVVLKGHLSVVAAPPDEDGVCDLWLNPTGNTGLASGGSGDVLTGLLTGLLAQGYAAVAAARLGVFLHGLAADLAVGDAPEALAASDVAATLGEAFAQLRA